MAESRTSTPPIRLLLADVDGTLVTSEKVLTDEAIEAVKELGEAGILFAVTSGRPPRGMRMLVEPLALSTPIAGFNGGIVTDPDMKVIEQRAVPTELVPSIVKLMTDQQLDVWIYQGTDWFVRNVDAPHVDREAWTVKFEPKVTTDLGSLVDDVVKIVGVSDDHDAVNHTSDLAHEQFGARVTAAASQPYYLDVTHPDANKGAVAKYLAERYQLTPGEMATIGDQPNDVLMFAHSGLSIAMGNADAGVRRSARRVTASDDDQGFAKAVRQFVLPAGPG
jgi:Cof subfamily protein (haloacid dehalogenase superfamily)